MLEVQGSVSYDNNIASNRDSNRPQSSFSKARLVDLAHPKETKQVWLTSFGPKLYWGDQDMMWPISDATLKARPTQRLMQLASAKKNFQLGTNKVNRPQFVYSCGRSSKIWEVSKAAMKADPSDHIKRLAAPKYPPPEHLEHRDQHQYSCGRVSTIWELSKAAQQCKERPRTAQLAKNKEPHRDYEPNREVETVINPPALRTQATERIMELASPKARNEGAFIDSRFPEDAIWKVSPPARAATASPRVLELAKHKGVADGYVPNRSVMWLVSKSARRAVVTPRSEELSKPIVRATMDHLQFNPDAFLVSRTAIKARCTPRLEELAQPIQR